MQFLQVAILRAAPLLRVVVSFARPTQRMQDEGFTMSMMTIQDETNVKGLEKANSSADHKRIKQARSMSEGAPRPFLPEVFVREGLGAASRGCA